MIINVKQQKIQNHFQGHAMDVFHKMCSSRKISILPSQKGLEIPGRRGRGSPRPKNLKQCLKLNWNFRRGGGVIGQIPSVGGMDIFWSHTIGVMQGLFLLTENKSCLCC